MSAVQEPGGHVDAHRRRCVTEGAGALLGPGPSNRGRRASSQPSVIGRATSRPPMTARSRRTASSPLRRMGWWTVVSGGSTCWARSMSSKPTTLTSPGIARPRPRRRAHGADRHHVAHGQDGGGPPARLPGRPSAAIPPSILAGPTRSRSSGMVDAGRGERVAIAAQAPADDAPGIEQVAGAAARPRPPGRRDGRGRSGAPRQRARRPASSTSIAPWSGRASSRRGRRQAGAPDLLDLRMVVRQADRHHAVDGRPAIARARLPLSGEMKYRAYPSPRRPRRRLR